MRTTTFAKQVSVSEINYMHEQGLKNKEIAERLGTSRATIDKYLPSKRKKYVRISNGMASCMLDMHNEGYSIRNISAHFNVSDSSVYRALAKKGVVFDKPKGTKKEKKDVGLPQPDKEEPVVQSGRLSDGVGVYKGFLGKYIVDKEDKLVAAPDIPHWLDKETLGHLIRDLMIVWQEV